MSISPTDNNMIDMEDELWRAVKRILDNCIDTKIESYPDDFIKSVYGLYLESETKEKLIFLCQNVRAARDKLSGLGFFSFKDGEFCKVAEEYLMAIKDLFQYIFIKSTDLSEGICPDIVRTVVEHDICDRTDDSTGRHTKRKIGIGICNPLILESLFIADGQISDFVHMFDDEEFCDWLTRNKDEKEPLYNLYTGLLQNGVERLFRDIEVLYNGKYYRITDYDEDAKQFIAVMEDDLGSIEQFNAVRLYDKIVAGQNDVSERGKSLIIGSLQKGSEAYLRSMLEDWLKNNDVVKSRAYDWITLSQDDFSVLKDSRLLERFLRIYDKVFILDCPGIYDGVRLNDMNDVTLIRNSKSESLSDIIGIDNPGRVRYFNNRNQFCTTYYRVQNMLLDKLETDSGRIRPINAFFFDYLNNMFRHDDEVRRELGDKEIYVYYSDSSAFYKTGYDEYDFVRKECHNSQTCRVFKFSAKENGVVAESYDRVITFTFLKILESVSCSGSFLCNMTGDVCGDGLPGSDRILNAIYTARNTKICIKYERGAEAYNDRSLYELVVDVKYPKSDRFGRDFDPAKNERYTKIINQVLRECLKDISYYNVDNRILFKTFHDIFVNVMRGCAVSYNDMLFAHLCKMHHEGRVDIRIKKVVFSPLSDVQVKTAYDDEDEEKSGYSKKMTAYRVMDVMDALIYLNSDKHRLIQRTIANQESLDDYVRNIRTACENLNYTDSMLYHRLSKL